MRHSTHTMFAVVVSILIYFIIPSLNNHINSINWFIIAGFAALVPDLDHPRGYLSSGNWEILSKAVCKTTAHRGWTHSLVGGLIFGIIAGAIFTYFQSSLINVIPFFFGYVSHLMSDSLNPTGVNWLWPKNKSRYKVGIISTGSETEANFQSLLLIGGVSLFIYDLMARGGQILP